jgi:hypothetical protein
VVAVTKRTRIVLSGAAVIVVAAVAVFAIVRSRPRPQQDRRPAIAIAVGELPPEPSVWVDVHEPGKVWRSIRSNAWLAQALAEPLGQGMAVGWAGFFGTKGGDLAGAFDGAILDVVADRLLADPFRVVFFSGPDATGAPAVVVSHPSSGARGAYQLLERVAHKGSYRAPRCPGPTPEKPEGVPPIDVSRWLVAEHAVFAGERGGQLAIARSPLAVVQALCVAPPPVAAVRGVDLTVAFSPDALGREAQLGAALLGLGPAPRLAFAVEGNRLEPRGVLDELGEPARLGSAAPPDALLGLVPADAGVVFFATLRLPEKLTRDSLAQHLGKSYRGPVADRPVAVVWNPRGNEKLPTEVAVLWPEADSALLREAFSGPNRMERRRLCGHEVLASIGPLASQLVAACGGQRPSILHAAPAVAAGVKKPASIAIGLNLGAVLPRLLGDASEAAAPAGKKPSPEMESARQRLEELPFLGLRGVVEKGVLVPGGFRS